MYVVQCDNGEIRHLPIGVLEIISSIGPEELAEDDVDGLEDGLLSDGDGHALSYCMSSDVDDDVLDDLLVIES